MELKYICCKTASACAISINCTFMELKCARVCYLSSSWMVLIVPLWNWNSILRHSIKANESINCTFMELKSPEPTRLSNWKTWVLIVPLWNWNSGNVVYHDVDPCINCTFMELKLLFAVRRCRAAMSINCTFMELKSL